MKKIIYLDEYKQIKGTKEDNIYLDLLNHKPGLRNESDKSPTEELAEEYNDTNTYEERKNEIRKQLRNLYGDDVDIIKASDNTFSIDLNK
ncbi:TPA: hypothetical protein RU507_002691 [Staphylococcus aureus]|nr:hypothetical protein [Staphylococcus aureus]HEA0030413.1 hypothetical protein [Staphylococcus aureus]HEA0065410.1 hypothetical protein [Staphylococcus aureus]HEA0070793.1 hypothetical protein [Staphylococcus aureus]HEA0073472.1 hypothetical protein [Staphylococcus aureus]